MLTMTINVKVPYALAGKLQAKLAEIMKAHDAEVEALAAKIKKNPSEALMRQQVALSDRSKRLTPHHLVRACVAAGLEALDKKPADLLALLAVDPIRTGRPSGSRNAA